MLNLISRVNDSRTEKRKIAKKEAKKKQNMGMFGTVSTSSDGSSPGSHAPQGLLARFSSKLSILRSGSNKDSARSASSLSLLPGASPERSLGADEKARQDVLNDIIASARLQEQAHETSSKQSAKQLLPVHQVSQEPMQQDAAHSTNHSLVVAFSRNSSTRSSFQNPNPAAADEAVLPGQRKQGKSADLDAPESSSTPKGSRKGGNSSDLDAPETTSTPKGSRKRGKSADLDAPESSSTPKGSRKRGNSSDVDAPRLSGANSSSGKSLRGSFKSDLSLSQLMSTTVESKSVVNNPYLLTMRKEFSFSAAMASHLHPSDQQQVPSSSVKQDQEEVEDENEDEQTNDTEQFKIKVASSSKIRRINEMTSLLVQAWHGESYAQQHKEEMMAALSPLGRRIRPWKEVASSLLEQSWFQFAITGLILFSSIMIGVEMDTATAANEYMFHDLEFLIVALFCV